MNKEIRVRCWIEIDGIKFFGPGPARLLELIQSEGSLSGAAKKMDMSYKKAWDLVTDLNTRGQAPYVVSHKGGGKGGGAELTAKGEEIVKRFRELNNKLINLKDSERELLSLI
ncbi:ModE family transcriptional regulator [Algoriphagus sp.]|jgi:molybdate transport system regulatory protein|uniref:winged helix-turn-helix domain-containing protein n=1 Tax=Algoriphagus sp. TaxID=1872435 RepID=UPI00329171F2